MSRHDSLNFDQRPTLTAERGRWPIGTILSRTESGPRALEAVGLDDGDVTVEWRDGGFNGYGTNRTWGPMTVRCISRGRSSMSETAIGRTSSRHVAWEVVE